MADKDVDYTMIDCEECNCSTLPGELTCGCGKHRIYPGGLGRLRLIHYQGSHWGHVCLIEHLHARCQREDIAMLLESDLSDDAIEEMLGRTGAMQ